MQHFTNRLPHIFNCANLTSLACELHPYSRNTNTSAVRKLQYSAYLEKLAMGIPAGGSYFEGETGSAGGSVKCHNRTYFGRDPYPSIGFQSEEHTSELQSLRHLVCRL